MLALAGCGGPTVPEVGLRADDRLIDLSTQLVPHPGSADLDAFRLILAEQAASVRDMASMTVAEFTAAHRRGRSDQAALMGTWYGRARRVLSGSGVAEQLDRAAREVGIDLPSPDPTSASKMVDALTVYFDARIPNEESDNPDIPDVYLLRSTFQNNDSADRER